jgi:queuine tRNA-ribosyltransferase
VLPARNARHGLLYTRQGVLRIKNAIFRDDQRPLDDACGCPACARVPRALVHHLIRSGEITGQVLATLHNVRFFLDFMGDLRQAVASGSLPGLSRPGPTARNAPDHPGQARASEVAAAAEGLGGDAGPTPHGGSPDILDR